MLLSKIQKVYDAHDGKRACQGDILKDFSLEIVERSPDGQSFIREFNFEFIIIISQDCDLEQEYNAREKLEQAESKDSFNNQFLPNILLLPAFPSEKLYEGLHLEGLYQLKQERKNSALRKPIKNNQNPRYHFLPSDQDSGVPEIIIDFKTYFTIPREVLYLSYAKRYLTTFNELFREDLSQRFAYYMSRVALPELLVSEV